MARSVMCDKIDAGGSGEAGAHMAGIDAFRLPHPPYRCSKQVIAQTAHIAGFSAASRGCNNGVRGIAANPLPPRLAAERAVEFEQRFANGDYVWLSHGGSSVDRASCIKRPGKIAKHRK